MMSRRKVLVFTGLCVMVIVVFVAVGAWSAFNPTYNYYGGQLSRDEILQRYEREEPLHCVQMSTSSIGLANGFECFDTIEEASDFSAMNHN